MTETNQPAEEPGPATVGAQTDPIQHTHLCPVCFENVDCKDFCATEIGDDDKLIGTPWQCDACKNAPADSIDIITGKVEIGDVLRCDEDGLVYEVKDFDFHVGARAELVTIVGYPQQRRFMALAIDGSPARRRFADNHREPLWFRVKG